MNQTEQLEHGTAKTQYDAYFSTGQLTEQKSAVAVKWANPLLQFECWQPSGLKCVGRLAGTTAAAGRSIPATFSVQVKVTRPTTIRCDRRSAHAETRARKASERFSIVSSGQVAQPKRPLPAFNSTSPSPLRN